jgi:hypothetical protein
MAQIPEKTKTRMKDPGVQFNRDPDSEKIINQGLLAIAKKAIGNTIKDDEPYTIRINFQNGRVVGSEAQPRLSVELLDGRSSTPIVAVPSESSEVFIEFDGFMIEGYASIENRGSWVARVKMDGDTIKSVFVNHDFSEEDRELIKSVLIRGFAPQVQM